VAPVYLQAFHDIPHQGAEPRVDVEAHEHDPPRGRGSRESTEHAARVFHVVEDVVEIDEREGLPEGKDILTVPCGARRPGSLTRSNAGCEL
jgi:hypothetical protein